MLNSPVSFAPPRVYDFELTSYCAGQCITCPKSYIFTRKPSHMPLELFQRIISQISPTAQRDGVGMPPKLHLFHYGDLCLYPQAFEAITIARQKGFYCASSSMASLVNHEKALEIIDTKLDEIWLMVDGMDDETLKKIRGKAASYKKALDNIKNLVHLKKSKGVSHPAIFVFMIRQPANAHQWDDFKNVFSPMFPDVHSHVAYLSNFGGNVPEINNLLRRLQQINGQPEEDTRVNMLNRYRCYYPWHSVSILSDGRVVPCCRDMNGTYVLGDLNKKSLAEIWNDTPIRNLRKEWIEGRVQNALCAPCTEANNEIGVPNKSFPFFSLITRAFSKPYRNPHNNSL